MTKIKKKIRIPIYGGYLIVIVTNNWNKIIKKYHLELNADECDAFIFDRLKKGVSRYYYIQRHKINFGNVAHEAKHIVNRIFKHRMVSLDIENDEAECYLLKWIVNKIYKMINKK